MAGDDPVVAWGVLLYDRRNLVICCCGVQAGSATEDSKAYLKVWTNLSAKPLDDGWYEDTNIQGQNPVPNRSRHNRKPGNEIGTGTAN